MARFLLFALIASLPVAGVLAEPPPTPPLAPPAPDAMPGKPPGPPDGPRWRKDKEKDPDRPPWAEGKRPPQDDENGPIKRFRKHFEEMSPEEQEHFRQNWQRWKGMPEGEKNDWKDRAIAERARVKKTIDEAMTAAGLHLSDDQKEVFVLRYRQERRRIEEELQKEFEAKRDEKMKAVLEQLRKEFSAAGTPTPAPTPAATP